MPFRCGHGHGCDKWLTYDPAVKSKDGRLVPITLDTHEKHDKYNCPSSRYNINKRSKFRATASKKESIKRIDDFELISEIQEHVCQCNSRLAVNTLELKVSKKEGEEF